MKVGAGIVRVELLEELSVEESPDFLEDLADVDILPAQTRFSMRTPAVLEKSGRDQTRRTFVIVLERADGSSCAVGIDVLQARATSSEVWPSGEHHVVLRGFSVDARVQGQGIGSAATALSVDLARRLFPEASALVLTVHVDNVSGVRVYERNGFERTGNVVVGRAGQEHVMAFKLASGHTVPSPW